MRFKPLGGRTRTAISPRARPPRNVHGRSVSSASIQSSGERNHKGLGVAQPEEVSSPTFTLIHEYSPSVYHIDLYRLDHPSQVATLGLDEIFDRQAVVLIEWGERFPQLMPENRIEIHLRTTGEDSREIEVRGLPSPGT